MATEIGLPEEMSKLFLKGASDAAAEEGSASRAFCKICLTKGKDSASRGAVAAHAAASRAALSRARCENCSTKMVSSSKIKATGGKSIKAAGKENEAKPAEIVKAASSNKMKAAGPASRAVAQVWREKPASTELIRKAAYEWLNKCGKPVKEDPASRPCCKVCKIVGEICDDMQVVTGCKICVAKAAALNRIKATGGDIIKAVEEGKAKPAGLVKASSLAQKDVMKTVTKENREGKLVTIVTDFLKKSPVILEATRACAAETLNSIKTQENALAQFFEMGYSTLELQVVDG